MSIRSPPRFDVLNAGLQRPNTMAVIRIVTPVFNTASARFAVTPGRLLAKNYDALSVVADGVCCFIPDLLVILKVDKGYRSMPSAAPTLSSLRRKPRCKDNLRPSAARRGYGGKRWQHLRRAVFLRDKYICQQPGCHRICLDSSPDHSHRPHCDHIVAKADGGTDDKSNLQTLCGSCHSYKTATENGGFAHG